MAIVTPATGKSTGPDLINNEMLKYGGDLLHEGILHLFNVTLKSGEYPKAWKSSIISPIHKGQDIHTPENYRGIAVADCISKLFCKILNSRIVKHLTDENFWRHNQNGFMEKRRTDDNIMIINTIFQKYVNEKKQKLYVAFIDFSKFFDSINRKFLLYKLLKSGITGKCYSILKSMYKGSHYSVKTDYGITSAFESMTGVKQGCALSPTLSNIFQNDLHDIFDHFCDPVELEQTYFNSLSWADDLVLISQSSEGLQSCLDKLGHYCDKWHLNVNVKKTKTMVMSKGNPKATTFYFSNNTLENVKAYKYLGLIISSNGSRTRMVNDRVLKAKRAAFAIKQAISTTQNISTKLSMSLFDKQIEPILLYGSPIWGIPSSTRSLKLKGDTLDTNTRVAAYKCLQSIGINDIKIVSCRRLKVNQGITLTVRNVSDKLEIMTKYIKTPATFTIEENDELPPDDVEILYSSFCKYSVGVSKYASTKLTLDELGRFPIKIRSTVLAILYWLRLEHSTKNLLLNKAFDTMKQENHPWIQNLQYALWQIGLGNIWQNPKAFEKKQLKRILTTRLKDIYIQTFSNYCGTKANQNKCKIINTCQQLTYEPKAYLTRIRSANIRNMFTRFRIDANCTMDSRYRSFRFKAVEDSLCKICNVVQSVDHVLLHCKGSNLTSNRSIFENKFCKYVPNYHSLSDEDKLQIVLNFKPLWKKVNENEACEAIYTFVKNTYQSAQGLNFSTSVT